jgi:MoxR-like ATPase
MASFSDIKIDIDPLVSQLVRDLIRENKLKYKDLWERNQRGLKLPLLERSSDDDTGTLSTMQNEKANGWLMRRLCIACSFYFGRSALTRRDIQRTIACNSSKIVTPESLQAILNIQPKPWAAFMTNFFAVNGVIRTFNGVADYHSCKNGQSCPEGFKNIKLMGETQYIVMLAQLRDELSKQKNEQNTDAKTELEGQDFEETEESSPTTEKPIGELQERLRNDADKLRRQLDSAKKDLEEAVKAAASKDEKKVLTIELKLPDLPETKTLDMVHKTTPALLIRVQCGLNVYLVGPAGSGKTTAAEKVAEALGLKFGFMSVGPQTTKSDVFGYMDAKGDYVATEFRRRYENGGVFLFDEIDAAHAGVLTQVNASLAGSTCAFPDRMVKRHAEFRCVAAGNTYGTGADRVYVGRNELDGASLDRFDFLEWGYDEALELAIAKTLTKDTDLATSWTTYVQRFRKGVSKLSLRHVVSPRATINGVKLLAAGVNRSEVMTTTLYKNLKPDEVKRVEVAMGGAS